MDETGGRLAFERRPGFRAEDALDFGDIGQREKQGLDKTQADLAGIGNQLERRYIHVVGAHLAVADDAIAGELETGDAKFNQAHVSSNRLIR